MKKGTNWLEIAAGAAIVVFSIGNSPLIPDEPIALPLGLGLIAHGFKYI